MDDSLDSVLRHIDLKARVFYAGNLCSVAGFDTDSGVGHLHLLRGGALDVIGPDGLAQTVSEPTLLFFPRPTAHRLRPQSGSGADLVCASVEFGAQVGNPLVHGLPALMRVRLADMPNLHGVLSVMFEEAFADASGRSAALDRLSEVVLIHLLRHAIDHRLLSSGSMAGLSDPRLSKALTAMHSEPARDWTLQTMATRAGMSRARFAAHFAKVVGSPPGDYLALWRIGLAQRLLAQGRPLKSISDEVGYGSANALTRAFAHRVGVSLTVWLARQRPSSLNPR